MKKLLTTAVLSLLAVGSLALTVPLKANGLTSEVANFAPVKTQTTSPTESGIKRTQSSTQESLVSVIYCETRFINGTWVQCCADHNGNWVCQW